MHPSLPIPVALLSLLPLLGCGDRPAAEHAASGPTAQATGCLAGGAGYLRATLRGAITADLYWRDAEMTCEGSLRPDAGGLRITLAGPLPGDGPPRRLRFLFGIGAAGPDGPARALPTNVTAIVEGEQQLYSTQGDDKCTTDSLQRETPDAARPRLKRIEVRGFCTGPASTLDGAERVLVSRFDFAASLTTEDSP
jgi:hypothetical protein